MCEDVHVTTLGNSVHTYKLFGTQEWSTCAVPCVFRTNDNGPADGTFGLRDGVPRIMRSMESSAYYPDHELESARRWVDRIFSMGCFGFSN